MKTSRFGETQIIAILKQAEEGIKVQDLCREHGISDATYYNWKAKYGGLAASDLKRLKEVESELTRLKPMYADLALENRALKDLIEKKLSPVLAPWEEVFRNVYMCGVQAPFISLKVFKDYETKESKRCSFVYLNHALNDLPGVWLLLNYGYTSQAASIGASLRRCCIIAVNSLNLLHFKIFAEIRKLLVSCVFLGIMQQRQGACSREGTGLWEFRHDYQPTQPR